jgi:hypothetical protein
MLRASMNFLKAAHMVGTDDGVKVEDTRPLRFFRSKEGGGRMKRGSVVFAVFVLFWTIMAASQALAVNVYGEGAYTATDVQVCIYADIAAGEELRSFGVRLVYNGTELTFDGTKSKKNEALWFLGDGTQAGNHAYRDPEDVDVDGTNRAVVIIGGKLDTNPGMSGEKVSGNRVLLGAVWFARSGSGAPSPMTLALGRPTPYANFVIGPAEADILDASVSFAGGVEVHERGDANADGFVDSRDIRALRTSIGSPNLPCWSDCNGDGILEPVVDSRDIRCLRMK